MNNTKNFNFNRPDFQKAAAAVMADLKENNVKCDTMDDMYNAMCRYVQVSREEFNEYVQMAEEEMESAEVSKELNSEELDTVVGGLPDFFFKSNWGKLAFVVCAALACSGAGAAIGAAVGAIGAAAGLMTGGVALNAAVCAITGAIGVGVMGLSGAAIFYETIKENN